MRTGTMWTLDFRNQDGSIRDAHVLILDFNAGNGMAIAVEVGYAIRPSSPVRIPFNIVDSTQEASALIHRVRSIDVTARTLSRVSEIDEASLLTVMSGLLSAIDGGRL